MSRVCGKPETVRVMLPLITGDTLLGTIWVTLVGSFLTVMLMGEEAIPLTVRVKETEPVLGNFSVIHLI